MTFEIHSNITNRSMTVAARAMRRVLRRKRNIIWAIFGWSVFLFNALLLIPFDGEPFALDVRTVTSLLVEVMLLSVLLFQDRFNGMIARKNALAGTKEYHVAFGEDSYTVVTAATTSTFRYELLDALAESQDYIIFLLKKKRNLRWTPWRKCRLPGSQGGAIGSCPADSSSGCCLPAHCAPRKKCCFLMSLFRDLTPR